MPAQMALTCCICSPLIDHYERPRNVGSMSKNDADVGTGLVGAPACGDVMKLQIRVDPNDDRIKDVKFKTFGCGSAIASSSYLTELVRGMTLEEAGRIRNTEIAKELCLPPVKRTLARSAVCASGGNTLADSDRRSALLNARRGRHQVRHQELLHQAPRFSCDRPQQHDSLYAAQGGRQPLCRELPRSSSNDSLSVGNLTSFLLLFYALFFRHWYHIHTATRQYGFQLLSGLLNGRGAL